MEPKRKRKILWSSKLAYATGLIATDGCLSIDGRHIDFTSKDIQLLETFKECLDLKNKIGKKIGGFSKKKYPFIQFSDIALYKWLFKIGLTPHKSKTISKLKIPNKYFFDFLRGEFDGDGSCYSYWDKRWNSSFMFYVKFISGSLLYLKWLRAKLKNFLKINGDISSSGTVWILRYAKKESKILISKMYYRKNLPYLKRKYINLKAILKTEQSEIEKENNIIRKRASAGISK